jgi:hypothetical protein
MAELRFLTGLSGHESLINHRGTEDTEDTQRISNLCAVSASSVPTVVSLNSPHIQDA